MHTVGVSQTSKVPKDVLAEAWNVALGRSPRVGTDDWLGEDSTLHNAAESVSTFAGERECQLVA